MSLKMQAVSIQKRLESKLTYCLKKMRWNSKNAVELRLRLKFCMEDPSSFVTQGLEEREIAV